ncbi:MAG TPA: polysaccharide deacetylase family protein [Candidatus Deferrimicrobium sp.]|nr:polysaccharide deacetylase family protein [Candidatus Deferrimicrobium sp.]
MAGVVIFVAATAPRVLFAGEKAPSKEICITFDQLPVAESFTEINRQEVTDKILAALRKHEVKAAGFVVGSQIGTSFDLLGSWLNDGHLLGNLTYSHEDLNQLSPDKFLQDVAAGNQALEPMLDGFGQNKRYFRYPYLHYGNTLAIKQQVREYLDEMQMVVVHATVVVDDYLYNLSFEKLGDRPDTAKVTALRNEYLAHVVGRVERSEELARDLLHRSCRHILQLRANRLNAESLDMLLTRLKWLGYRFVELDYALQDKVYSSEEAYFGPRGMGYLDMIRQSNPDLLPAR